MYLGRYLSGCPGVLVYSCTRHTDPGMLSGHLTGCEADSTEARNRDK